MEIAALSGASKHNHEVLQSAMDSYMELLFPASKKKVTKKLSFEDQAKKQLVEEVKKAYLIRPAGEESLKTVAEKGTDQARTIAARYLKEKPKKVQKVTYSDLPDNVTKF